MALDLNGPLVVPGAGQCVKEVPLTLALDASDTDYLAFVHSEADITGDPAGKTGQAQGRWAVATKSGALVVMMFGGGVNSGRDLLSCYVPYHVGRRDGVARTVPHDGPVPQDRDPVCAPLHFPEPVRDEYDPEGPLSGSIVHGADQPIGHSRVKARRRFVQQHKASAG